jgi:muramoyltetrapeptide carboxypeptidase LdcA involved in peptidoglycan recycling
MLIRPNRIKPGDTIAAISLSSGTAALVPHRYAAGKHQIEVAFGLKVVESPNALRPPDWLYRNPQARADDLHWALENPSVSAVGGFTAARNYTLEIERYLTDFDAMLLGRAAECFSHRTATFMAMIEAAAMQKLLRSIFSMIGGNESVRILPHVNSDTIRTHPKIMLGASDTTVTLTAFSQGWRC